MRYELTFYKAIEELIELNLHLIKLLEKNVDTGYLYDQNEMLFSIKNNLKSLKKKFEVMGPP